MVNNNDNQTVINITHGLMNQLSVLPDWEEEILFNMYLIFLYQVIIYIPIL